MIRRACTIFILTVLCIVSFANTTQAQALGGASVSVSLFPTSPGPNQQVTITVNTYSFSLQTAEIDWTVDGGKTVGGIGYSKYTITTKKLGSPTVVTVTITPIGSLPVVQTITVVPSSVDILWQATDSVVPPFYRGKALVTSESKVKFVAIPQVLDGDGSLIPTSGFLYEWRDEYNPDDAHSGFGKNVFTTAMDYINPTRNIGVDISGRDGTVAASSDVALDPSDPKLVWYAGSPLYGTLYNHALTEDYTVKDSDASLVVFPYYFSPGNPTSSQISYTWSLNGNTLSTPATPNTLFLHRSNAEQGDALVNVSMLNTTKLFQELQSSLTLHLQ